MMVCGDFVVGMLSLTNSKGETKRYVKRRALGRPDGTHLAVVSRMEAALQLGGDREPILKGNKFPPTIVVEQSARAAVGIGVFPPSFIGAWAYTVDERAYRIRESISGFESEALDLDPAALKAMLDYSEPDFTWSLAEVQLELEKYSRQRGYHS
jgi:hypothetical protein